jgi:tetratricopeptide (TPR) repeat protein
MKLSNINTILLLFFLIFFSTKVFALSTELKKEIEEKQKIVAQKPNDPNAHFDLAISLSYSGFLEEGWGELTKVDQLDPKYTDKAIEKYDKIITQNADDWRARFRLAFAYYFTWFKDKTKTAFREKAVHEFEEIIKRDPKNIWAYNYMGYVFAEDNNLDKSIPIWKKSISIDPDEPITHFVLGHAYLRKGDYLKGLSEISTAYKLKTLRR